MSSVVRSSSSPSPGPFGVAPPSSSSAALLGLHGASHIPGMPGLPPPGSASSSSMNAAHQSMAMAMAAHAAQAAGLASLRRIGMQCALSRIQVLYAAAKFYIFLQFNVLFEIKLKTCRSTKYVPNFRPILFRCIYIYIYIYIYIVLFSFFCRYFTLTLSTIDY